MRRVRAFFSFWYEFVVGDDPWVVVGVIVALSATAGLVAARVPAWWVMPVAVAGLLGLSLVRVVRSRG